MDLKKETIAGQNVSELRLLFAGKKTENGDDAFNTTGNKLTDILFMSAYYEKNLQELHSYGDSALEKLFAMFVRDPRFGLGRRDLGRHLMLSSKVSPHDVVVAGRYDDLLQAYDVLDNARPFLAYVLSKAKEGEYLAKKWLPRLTNKDKHIAKGICRMFNLTEKEYRAIIKNTDTTEYKLSSQNIHEIDYEKVESLAMLRYFKTFKEKDTFRFNEYLESVQKGEKKLNVTTTTVYDIYRNRHNIDPDLFMDKIEKVSINCIPILDTSGSMYDNNDSMGKAMSIAHYLAKGSSFAPNHVISFSSRPQLMEIHESTKTGGYRRPDFGNSKYGRELNSMYTGDVSNTDFGAVMNILSKMETFPDYLVVLSDMEFDDGSNDSKEETMRIFKEKGAHTKIVWWNFNSRSATVPELDTYGNIFMSGYSPQLLKYLEAGFDSNQFLQNLLVEYAKNIGYEQ